MTLRRPAAHLRRAPGWRRSGDESCWEGLVAEGGDFASASHPKRTPRPHSAIEGGQLDSWLEHLQRMQSSLLRSPDHDQVLAFNNRTASIPALHKEPTGHPWKQQGIPTFSGGSSSCGSPGLYQSSLGSQESLKTGVFCPRERRGSWERAHIKQVPKTEKTQLSYLAPVKIGWLPIQRKVTVACKQSQFLDHCVGQVKLKQPITPTIQMNRETANRQQDEEVKRGYTALQDLGAKTPQIPDQESPITTQVPAKQSFLANERNRPVAWQALRSGWNSNRVSAFPGGTQSNELTTGTSSDPNRTSPLMKTTSTEPLKYTPHRSTSADPCKPHTLLRGTNGAEACKSYTPLQRTSSVQPLRATAPLCRANSSSQPSNVQTRSAVTTLVPQNKAGFSSITISSRKVSRSASLPGSANRKPPSQCDESPSLPLPHQSMDPSSRQVTVQRKATIVKVTEQRVMSSPAPSTERAGTPPANHALDTVVRRRKATIIKVTEHRESYSPAKVGSGTRRPEYRHSYTDGSYKENSTWCQGTQSHHQLDSTKRPNAAVASNESTSDAEKHGGALHRSTLNLFVGSPPALAAAATSEVSLRAAGRRSDRPQRPLSCYGSVCGRSEPIKEYPTQPPARKWSFGLPQETNIGRVTHGSGFISPPAAAKAGQLVTNTPEPNGCERERLPPENAERRMSPSLTLIKATDPHSRQSPEEVLALNAAAIIANIKLQRQLSKKKASNVSAEKDSTASPQANTATDEGERMRPRPDHNRVQHRNRPHAAFVPLGLDPEGPTTKFSLQESLQRSRPDIISRSQCRVRELERRKQERRELAGSAQPHSVAAVRQRRVQSSPCASLNGSVPAAILTSPISHTASRPIAAVVAADNLLKPRDRAITGKGTPLRSKRALAEVKKQKEEAKKKEVCLSNRQRVELFRKRLLDQILQRSNS